LGILRLHRLFRYILMVAVYLRHRDNVLKQLSRDQEDNGPADKYPCIVRHDTSAYRGVFNRGNMNRKPRLERASETDIAFGVLVIAAFQSNGLASFYRLRREIPIHVRLSDFDTAESIMRPNEENWMHRLRGIGANAHMPGNFVYEGFLIHVPRVGFRITPLGYRRRMRGRYDRVPSST
jgi:hypothetical protein